MALFAPTIDDDEWESRISELAPRIAQLCDLLEPPARDVARAPLHGWSAHVAFFQGLQEMEGRAKEAKRAFEAIGKPRQAAELKAAHKDLHTFFEGLDVALYWGKLHYKDASGGPGHRAVAEHGLAQRAAIKRVANNGTKFAEAATASCAVARSGLKALEVFAFSYRPNTPGLRDLFLAMTGQRLEQKRTFAQVAVLESWCFKQGAILGMLLCDTPEAAVAAIWDPNAMQNFYTRAQQTNEVFAEQAETSYSLGFVYLATQYRGLFGPEALLSDQKAATSVRVSKDEVLRGASAATAMGYGFGILEPELVGSFLEMEAEPDEDNFRRARQAGLAPPTEHARLSVDEQIAIVVDACLPFFRSYYPEAYDALLNAEV